MNKNNVKLEVWKERLSRNQTKYQPETDKMDGRERLYLGDRKLRKVVRDDMKNEAVHVRNICSEIIEAQVNSDIPQPKVRPRRQADEDKAKLIEDMIRNELDRLPMECINDMMERTVPIQGGAMFLLEWDNTQSTNYTVGELNITAIHPKMIVPQDGVYSGIEDMDYIILKLPQTKEYIKRRYGKDVSDESESEANVKGLDGTDESADDLVTQYVAYYRNDKGGIGIYSWVNDIELEDIEDYQARRLSRCTQCGETEDPNYTDAEGRHVCYACGNTKFQESEEQYEEFYQPMVVGGMTIPGSQNILQADGTLLEAQPTKIPYYKPDIYPIILQKNVSVFGKFLGDSDIDKIADQQNTANRIESKIIDKLLQSGSYITLPDSATIKVDSDDMKVIRPGSPADKAMIGVYDLEGNVQQDMQYLEQVYNEARQLIGITDSFQGRHDSTATSGKAKEFAAAQSAGRLESKRVMKNAAYASLFEAMFKFMLAYADEPRTIISEDINGNKTYKEFNRYDFLEQDEAGNWVWNDQFLFSCDTSAPLANNREAMWQETRMNFQTGTFGNPQDMQTLILFWRKMEQLHYPTAAETRLQLEQRYEEQMRMQQQQMAMVQQAQNDARQQMMAQGQRKQMAEQNTLAQAKADAAREAMARINGVIGR